MTFEGRHDAGFQMDDQMASHIRANDGPDRTLVVALDVPTYDEACAIVDELGSLVHFYKIGLELLFHDGLRLAQELRDKDKWVFLDMKFLDIPNTVERAVRNVARYGVNFVTVHAQDRRTLDAAVRGRAYEPLKLLGVTVLTSSTPDDLTEQGVSMQPQELALRRARMACDAGLDGVIASGFDAEAIRRATNDKFVIKCPGIRPSSTGVDDQARVMTPTQAILAGADYLVIGRPILQAKDRRQAAEAIIDEINAAKAKGRRN